MRPGWGRGMGRPFLQHVVDQVPGHLPDLLSAVRVPSRVRSNYISRVLALLLVALSVGMDNFGASIAIGVSGIDRRLRIRTAVIFGVFEAAMPVVGLLLGHSLAHDLGTAAKPIGGALLGLAGAYA